MSSIRMLSIVFSVAAVVLFYLLLQRITSPPIALAASVAYGLSAVFLGFADSLANHPLDDLLRMACMVAIVASTRAASGVGRKRWGIAAWGLEFLLSLSSYDSVFFVYIWLVGWDLLDGQGFRWRRYLVFAIGPVLAQGILFLQNVWYLGVEDTVRDIVDTFARRGGIVDKENRIVMVARAACTVLTMAFWRPWIFVGLLTCYVSYFSFLDHGKGLRKTNLVGLLGLLAASGLGYVAVLPHASYMAYQGRQALPFAALVFGGATVSLFAGARRMLASGRERLPGLSGRLLLPYLIAGSFVTATSWIFLLYNPPRMPGGIDYAVLAEHPDSLLAKSLVELPTQWDPVYLNLGGFTTFWDATWVDGFPQVFPNLEYYTGSRPILSFDQEGPLVEDLRHIVGRSAVRFSPVIVAADKERLYRVASMLHERGVLREMPPGPYMNLGRYVLDLSEYIVWGEHERAGGA
ncbi:MAG: hypothetical protein P1P84_07115 [Deferrisomatales bacterium]|nr:hypothetical protein [Deferrisomatales bacterium]